MKSLRVERLEDRVNPAPIPVLNSFPSAPSDIYMDFDGEGTTTAYDTDGNPADYSASEVADITRAHDQLSKYFAMFNVNVTTVYTAARPKAWLMLGNNISGGYSYVNVFPNTEPESFNQSSDARGRVSGLAHEVGHNFGLSHQSDFNNLGVETADYISAKEPLRGFLMGVDYNGTIKKWSWGHTSNASGLQDDIAIIAADLSAQDGPGDGFRPDDVGGTIATATALTGTSTGIIERMSDIDVWSFTTLGGPESVTVAPVVPSGLDAVLEIRDAANTVIAVADTAMNGQTITVDLPAGTYYAFVSSKGNYGDVGMYDIILADGGPDGFQTTNLGLSWFTGRTAYSGSAYTVTGSGADIWGTADAGQFAYKYLSGDGTITARVTGIENTNAHAKAGVMIRESLDAGARNVATLNKYAYLPVMQYRSSTNGSTSSAGGASGTFAARWVRITKTGNSLVSAWSTNGTTWTTLGTQTVTLGTNFYVGLAVTSHEDEETNTTDDLNDATISNVTITGFSDPLTTTNTTIATPTGLAATLGTGTAVSLAWNTVAGASTYAIERSSDGITFSSIGSTATLAYTDSTISGSQRWSYRVRAVDASGRGTPSGPVHIVNRPSAINTLETTAYTTTSVVLDWRDTNGESGFKVERSADGGTTWTTLTSTLARNIPSYTATGLTTGLAYQFRVTPTSTLGDGPATTLTSYTRLATVGGVTLGAVDSTSISLSWADVTGSTGFRIERATDNTFATITTATVGDGVLTYTATGLSPETEYYFRVVATGPGTESTAASVVVMAATPPTTAIITPWIAADIGTPTTQRGMTATAGTGFKIASGGADIAGTTDGFRFTYQQLVGNGAITARVDTLDATGSTQSGTGAKLGVMIREALGGTARHGFVGLTQAGTIAMLHRSTTAGSTSTTGTVAAAAAPYWVRIVRVGNTLTGYASANGTTWTTVGTATLSNLAQTLFIGLAGTANSTATLNTSTVSGVDVRSLKVNGVQVNDGNVQRSQVRTLTVSFNGHVTIAANAFTLSRTGGGSVPTFSVATTTTTATLTFSTPLSDGEYTLTTIASAITDASGFGLGTLAANHTATFHRLFGDIDGNRTVDSQDFAVFGTVFGQTITNNPFDIDLDNTISANDFIEFGTRFGKTI